MPTLIVEDGSKVTDANSYVSLADANAYFELYSSPLWTATQPADEQKTIALINGRRSMDLLYQERYLGEPVRTDANDLLFPRYSFYDNYGELIDSSEIPNTLKYAQCEFASLYLQGADMFPEISLINSIDSENKRIGDLQISQSYRAGQTMQTTYGTLYRKAELWLGNIITSSPTSTQVVFRR